MCMLFGIERLAKTKLFDSNENSNFCFQRETKNFVHSKNNNQTKETSLTRKNPLSIKIILNNLGINKKLKCKKVKNRFFTHE